MVRLPGITCFTCFLATFFDYIDNTIVARVFMTGVFYYGYLQHTTSFLMTFNRFTAVFFPFEHNAVSTVLIIQNFIEDVESLGAPSSSRHFLLSDYFSI